MVPYSHVLFLASAVFILGLICLLTRRNLIMILMGIEIMMNGAAILFLGGSLRWQHLEGQAFVLFLIGIAAAEVSVGLALTIAAYRQRKTVDPDQFNLLKG
jgi:NADH-quinone oxidoreductase subunit K